MTKLWSHVHEAHGGTMAWLPLCPEEEEVSSVPHELRQAQIIRANDGSYFAPAVYKAPGSSCL